MNRQKNIYTYVCIYVFMYLYTNDLWLFFLHMIVCTIYTRLLILFITSYKLSYTKNEYYLRNFTS